MQESSRLKKRYLCLVSVNGNSIQIKIFQEKKTQIASGLCLTRSGMNCILQHTGQKKSLKILSDVPLRKPIYGKVNVTGSWQGNEI
jgi:hypothetical protein